MMMRSISYPLLLVAILLGSITGILKAQSPFDPEYSGEAEQIQEEVHLFTDRNLYAVNEVLHFLAEHRTEGIAEGVFWSSVLYVELVTAEGEAVEQGKFPLFGGRARGSMQIPVSALSGDYYLKCYTRWMRNQGPSSFAFVPVKIINPFRPEVLTYSSAANQGDSLSRVPYLQQGLDCSTLSGIYGAGDTVRIRVEGPLPDYLDRLNCCLTVVPEGAVDESAGQCLYPSSGTDQEPYSVSFLPDLGSGVSVSGTVLDADQNPFNSATLHFSLLGDRPDYFATISDEYGRFIFTAPAGHGPQELFVTPQRVNGSPLEVRIDQEFDGQAVKLPGGRFHLTEAERELARRISLNMQLSRAYRTGTLLQKDKDADNPETIRGKNIPFYGSRVKRLLIDDYVRLPNLEEVFINLIPDVQFYRKRGENRIRILSQNASIGIFDPLIMIDHISVFDHEAVLALTPDKIERIDLINEVYLKGNVAFGGVLAIYSRKGDMAGIDLPEGSYFFDYHSFYPSLPASGFGVNKTDPAASGRIPDTRNTLYWRDDLQLIKGNALEFLLIAPETPGDYVILVRGLDPRGEVLAATSRFRVE